MGGEAATRGHGSRTRTCRTLRVLSIASQHRLAHETEADFSDCPASIHGYAALPLGIQTRLLSYLWWE